jgi:integrase/recombinase XerC/integrase/recombinase XerD
MVDLQELFQRSLQQVQAMVRHSDPKITMVYFHNLNRLQAGAERFIQI